MGGKKKRRQFHRGSGHFPLSFNFVHMAAGKHIQCSYCGKFVHERFITRDHIYPKSKGGLIKTPACGQCNMLKEDQLPIEWAIFAAKQKLDLAVIPIGYDETIEDAGVV